MEDGKTMERMKEFLTEEEEQQVVTEIRSAELKTRGEIRVVITAKRVFRPERYSWKAFERMGMAETEERNGALIVVLSRHRRFFVLGDKGLNEVVEPGYWEEVAESMSSLLREGQRSKALCEGVRQLADTMAAHWPANGVNPNELPDQIAYD